MVLESTIICVDNSDFMRNGDFIPTRLQAQQDAVNLVCHSKTRSNPENNVGLLVMSGVEVLATLTADVGRILSKLHQIQPKGEIKFSTAIRVAHLALKHRQGRNHKMRIVIFVGSPVDEDEKELIKVAKKLKKEKVCVDIVNFGEETVNTDVLTSFVNTINGKDGTSSHLVTVPPGPMLSEALMNSPIVVGEDGTGAQLQAVGFEFGVDPNEDPELALVVSSWMVEEIDELGEKHQSQTSERTNFRTLGSVRVAIKSKQSALRVSMEEQRARQEDEAKKATAASTETPSGVAPTDTPATGEEALLEQALAMSMNQETAEPTPTVPDFGSMTEDDQIAYAMQMSLQNSADNTPAPMDVDDEMKTPTASKAEEKKPTDDDYSEVMNDPEFLQSVLENLPGVDPQSEAIQNAMSSLTKDAKKKDDSGKKDKDSQ